MSKPSDVSISPVEGLRSYVRGWKQLAAGRNASFDAVLDAAEHYIDTVMAPAYANDPEARSQLDAFWSRQTDTIYLQPERQAQNSARMTHLRGAEHFISRAAGALFDMQPIRINTDAMGVARSFIECWVADNAIGEDTDAYRALENATMTFCSQTNGRRAVEDYATIREKRRRNLDEASMPAEQEPRSRG